MDGEVVRCRLCVGQVYPREASPGRVAIVDVHPCCALWAAAGEPKCPACAVSVARSSERRRKKEDRRRLKGRR